MKDLYTILGISKEASDADIKKAYRKKAQEFHPDKNPGDKEAEAKFKEVQGAYEILSDKQKRQQYDQFGSTGGPGGFGGAGFQGDFGGFADIFESFFGGGGAGFPGGGFGAGRPSKPGPVRGSDIQTELVIRFEEAIFGATRDLELTKPETCVECTGSGMEKDSKMMTCDQCQGSGQVRSTRQTILGAISSVRPCPKCEGRGQIPEKVCQSCKGAGRTQQKQRVSIKIPKGVEDGTRIRMAGKGSAGLRGGPHGDLFLHIRVSPHARFSRQGETIYSTETFPFLIGVLGATVKIDTVHGKAELKVPAGTQSGSEFVLRSKGAPNLKSEVLGDHKVTLHLETPRKLKKQDRELYEQLAESAGLNVDKGGSWFS